MSTHVTGARRLAVALAIATVVASSLILIGAPSADAFHCGSAGAGHPQGNPNYYAGPCPSSSPKPASPTSAQPRSTATRSSPRPSSSARAPSASPSPVPSLSPDPAVFGGFDDGIFNEDELAEVRRLSGCSLDSWLLNPAPSPAASAARSVAAAPSGELRGGTAEQLEACELAALGGASVVVQLVHSGKPPLVDNSDPRIEAMTFAARAHFLGELLTADGRPLFPSISAMRAVILNLAVKEANGDQSAGVAVRRLVQMLAAMDYTRTR